MYYPTIKVIVRFTLCPIIPAPIISAVILSLDLHEFTGTVEWYYWLPAYVGMTLWVSLCALIFFGVPALMLSVVYATLQLRRSAKHLFLVSLSGGALAFMFNGLFLPPLHEIAAITLGLVTSLLAALFALPKQTTLSYD
ncbi:hypothetical protein J2T09_003440 [Neorhizobium huautlense]|uniref:Transmembrane protein n=1 Tax=Neorhizobium huautlense TaxID=67774 RepID=A0ABT9PX22_9HYPH|nr:hypothetical protein [Neorhizobium huautlense]MDP9838668.1 hypothetical protein [Neorhizobium huautlense]